MHVAAFVISLISSIISIFQSVLAGSSAGLRAGVYHLFEGHAGKFGTIAGFALLILVAALVALVGGALALTRKSQARTVLAVSAGLCFLASLEFLWTGLLWGGAIRRCRTSCAP